MTFIDNGDNLHGTPGMPINPGVDSLLLAHDGPALFGGFFLLTHNLLAGSPAIGGGNEGALPGLDGIPVLDQRGTGFARVYNALNLPQPRIDIGAIEVQPSPLVGDYNFDRVVNSTDYIVWRNTVGSTTDKRADGNRDGSVNRADFVAWKANYGETLVSAGLGSSTAIDESAAATEPITQVSSAESSLSPSPQTEARPTLANGGAAMLGISAGVRASESRGPSVNAQPGAATFASAEHHDDALLALLAVSSPNVPADESGGAELGGDSREDDSSEPAGVSNLDDVFASLGSEP
jgi:hypothetical protein